MDRDIVPEHLGFVVDGNRRWAKSNGLPSLEGHRRGLTKVEEVAEECFARGVKFVTFYLFSTENWGRAEEEVGYLMKMVLLNVKRLAKKLAKNNIRLMILGSRDNVSEEILVAIDDAVAETRECTGGVMGVCFNYGGRDEIVRAARRVVDGGEEISEESLGANLDCPGVPDVDMIVRTSGEERLSGFLLWRAAYSEFLFLEKMWPEMERRDVEEILREYAKRSRRFGK